MPKFMDMHQMPGVTKEKVAEAHQKDLEVQSRHDTRFVRYWVDEKQGHVFCLSEAPNAEAVRAAHKEAGHPPVEVYEVFEGQ